MPDILKPGGRIGIIGGGQLGRMSAMAAAEMGFHCHIFSPRDDEPALDVAPSATIGAYDDAAALRRFAENVDVITFEFENIPAESIALLESLKPVHPSRKILEISQDRITEKSRLNAFGLKTAPWVAVTDPDALASIEAALGFPFILKQTRFGYDGKGQWRVNSPQDLEAIQETLPYPLIAEGLVDFDRELSVIVARDLYGEASCFDVTENRHHHGILDISLAPARISPELAASAQDMACRIAHGLALVGILAVELFLDAKGELRVNEIAPRPHNSGHWTQDACLISQFEAHIRMVAGLRAQPLTRHSDAVMKNLVGPGTEVAARRALETLGTRLHLYGKAEARPGRKMGHVNALFPKGALPGDLGLAAALGPILNDGLE
ncbi:N5-carboxyaminoimidazole ribonucleotide synthase [Acetobacteraceae bacterium EV16G]|uniref:N5-carboxyaminoimidazole ribonucleotide synthase n=1 Tax=Sorlinia euscelidii TaxID=3081148 RepID=A0ABU7U6I0_9PROT